MKAVEVELEAGGKLVARARALAVAKRDVPAATPDAEPLPTPESCPPFSLPFQLAEARLSHGDGRAARARHARQRTRDGVDARRVPLLSGETLSPLERVMLAADSGNGVSAHLDASRFTFLNADLSVCLYRYPVGDWVALDAQTSVGESGVGLADARLHDGVGPIGEATQPLIVEMR